MALSHQPSLWEGIRAARAVRLGLAGVSEEIVNATTYPMLPDELKPFVDVRVLPIIPSQVDTFGDGGVEDEGTTDGTDAREADDIPADLSPQSLLPPEQDLPLGPFAAPLPHVRWIDPRPADTVQKRAEHLLSEAPSTDPPRSCAGRSVIVHLHGGGHHLGGSGAEDGKLAYLANSTGLPVAAVSYRLSPQVRFPSHFEDAVRGLAWVARSARALGADERCVVLMGDSAGGQLAASLALFLREAGGALPQTAQEAAAGLPPLRARAIAQVLVYPLVDSAVHLLGPQPASGVGQVDTVGSTNDGSTQTEAAPRDYPSLQHPWADWRPLLPTSLTRSFGLGSLPRGVPPGGRRGRVGYGVAGVSGGDGESGDGHGGGSYGELTRTLHRVWRGASEPMDSLERLAWQHGYYGLKGGVRLLRAEQLPDEAVEALRDWRLCPAAAGSLARLPPALVITAGWDPLLDEGRAYCDRLRREEEGVVPAGRPRTRCLHHDGMFHGYYGIRSGVLPGTFRQATEDSDAGIRELLREVGASRGL